MKLIITSPPYNLGKEYETKRSMDVYLDAQRQTITEAVRVLHPQGSICWQIGNYVEDGEVFPVARQVTRAQAERLVQRIVDESRRSRTPIKVVIRDPYFMAATVITLKRQGRAPG